VAIEFDSIPAKVDLPDISVELKEASPPEVLQITITGVDIEKGIPGDTRKKNYPPETGQQKTSPENSGEVLLSLTGSY
jgi:hypothetical protein